MRGIGISSPTHDVVCQNVMRISRHYIVIVVMFVCECHHLVSSRVRFGGPIGGFALAFGGLAIDIECHCQEAERKKDDGTKEECKDEVVGAVHAAAPLLYHDERADIRDGIVPAHHQHAVPDGGLIQIAQVKVAFFAQAVADA